jgi:AraC family transcriptional regulator
LQGLALLHPANHRRHSRALGKILPTSVTCRVKKEVTYGVCCNFDGKGGFDYIAGVEISKLDDLPEQYRWVEIQPQYYAVFEHKGPLESLSQTFRYICDTWLPQSGHQAADAPEFERYSEDFNPRLKTGTLEIWLPIKV